MILFHRDIALPKNSTDLQECFKYELASRFADLLGYIDTESPPTVPTASPVKKIFVINRGFLLHAVGWKKLTSFRLIWEQYDSYLNSTYGDADVVVFAGYDNRSINHFEQSRRGNFLVTESKCVQLDGSLPMTQYDFLKHNINKEKFLKLLILYIESQFSLKVLQAKYDVDFQIVNTSDTHIV